MAPNISFDRKNFEFFIPSRFPDDEIKKNECCIPFNAPQLPAQWFELSYRTNMNIDKVGKTLGFTWLRNNRLSPFYHMSFIGLVQTMIYMVRNKDKINEKLKLFGEQGEKYAEFSSDSS